MDYRDYNDYELLDYIKENNEDANNIIYKKYEPLIYKIAKKMYKYGKKSGLELNDLIQEGMLGLSKAIDSFDSNADALFYTYAKLCIERKIISAVIAASRNRQKALNEAISIDSTFSDLEYAFKNDTSNPEKILLNEEKKQEMMKIAKTVLTDFELQVFELKISEFSYKEIAEILEKEPKAIDNALQRIKNKLKKEVGV
ncbi:MAG: sigma-70 family RNA polymerase sigma factor [Bacilli bacterium]|nr:sigma-70 family RNA polymerase sigma factor [Bacilli bacterium]